jgi:hypothetical protein
MIIARGHPGYPTLTSVPERLFCVARSMQSHDRIGRSESAIGGEEPPFSPSRAVICTACRLTCDIRLRYFRWISPKTNAIQNWAFCAAEPVS